MRRRYSYDEYDDGYEQPYVQMGYQNSRYRGSYRRQNSGYSNRYNSGYGNSRQYGRQSNGAYDSGYDGRYATDADENPSLSSRILNKLSSIGGSRKQKKEATKKPPVRVSNVVYEDCEKAENYKKYLLKANENVE